MDRIIKHYIGVNSENLEPIIEFVEEDPNILAVVLFGSYAREEDYRDVDICFFLYPDKRNRLNDARYKLSTILSLPEYCDISYFHDLPLYVRSRVQKEGRILLNKNYEILFDIYIENIKAYNLYKPHLAFLLGD